MEAVSIIGIPENGMAPLSASDSGNGINSAEDTTMKIHSK